MIEWNSKFQFEINVVKSLWLVDLILCKWYNLYVFPHTGMQEARIGDYLIAKTSMALTLCQPMFEALHL